MELSNPDHRLFVRVSGRDIEVRDIAHFQNEANHVMRLDPQLSLIDTIRTPGRGSDVHLLAAAADLGSPAPGETMLMIYTHGEIFGPFWNSGQARKWADANGYAAADYVVKSVQPTVQS